MPEKKHTNLTVSLDVTNQSDFFNILEPIADDVLMVKTHVDILDDFDSCQTGLNPNVFVSTASDIVIGSVIAIIVCQGRIKIIRLSLLPITSEEDDCC